LGFQFGKEVGDLVWVLQKKDIWVWFFRSEEGDLGLVGEE